MTPEEARKWFKVIYGKTVEELVREKVLQSGDEDLPPLGSMPASGEEMLRQAAQTVEERRKTYGDPIPHFRAVAKRWSLRFGQEITAAQVVLCMIDLKAERLDHDPTHADSILDIAGYAAILQEIVK